MSDVLTARLAELFEPSAVTRLVEEALGGLTDEPVHVEDSRIEYCKTKPSTETVLAIVATLYWPRSQTRTTQYFSCTVLPRLEQAQQQAEADVRRLEGSRLAGRKELSGFRRLVTVVAGRTAVVRLFPADSVLSSLVELTESDRMAAFFRVCLPECVEGGWEPVHVAWHVVHYKPGRLCTLRYSVALERAGGTAVRVVEYYGKTFRDERWRDNATLLRLTAEAARASGGWRSADLVATWPEWRFTLQSTVPGRRFSHVFAELTHDAAGEAELQQVEACLRGIARAARAIHLAPIDAVPALPFASLIAAQNRNLEYLGRVEPGLARDLIALQQALLRAQALTAPAPRGFAHGDFAHGNVLVDGDVAGIIDFDRAGVAEAAYDVAYFLTHLTSYGIRHPRRQPHVERLCQAFREECLRLAPDVSPQRLALYEALDLSAYVLRNFRKQSHQARWLRWAPEQIAASWDRLAGAGV
jgi:Ser/Thr protein kinase RdoA (MazF antagonist)